MSSCAFTSASLFGLAPASTASSLAQSASSGAQTRLAPRRPYAGADRRLAASAAPRLASSSSAVFGCDAIRAFEAAGRTRGERLWTPAVAPRASADPYIDYIDGLRRERKAKLLAAIAASNPGEAITPMTDRNRAEIESAILMLEAVTPHPSALKTGLQDLNGSWRLLWSTANEIRRLRSLPFKLGAVYQNVDVPSGSFENVAYLTGGPVIRGYVRVKASFSPETDRVIRVRFNERQYIAERILGREGETVLGSQASLGGGTLDVTYLDPDLRVGRGGEGSLFVLTKAGGEPSNY